jgi:hypothetical protein
MGARVEYVPKRDVGELDWGGDKWVSIVLPLGRPLTTLIMNS